MLRRFLTVGFALMLAIVGTGAVVSYARTSDPQVAASRQQAVASEPAMVTQEAEARPPAVPDGKFAVSIEVPPSRQAGGNVVAGSDVAVFAVVPTPREDGVAPATRLLLARASVLTTGAPAVAGTAPKPGSGAWVTLALAQTEVERLLQAGATGTLHLALLSPTTRPAVGPGVDSTTLFAAPDGSQTP